MAQYTIDFSGETTGAAPANFTERWTATGETWAVREKAGALGGKTLEHTRTTTARRGFSWDTPGSDTDTEILVRWRSTTATATDQFWMLLRGSGSAGSETAYIFRNTSSTGIQIARVVAGTITTIGSTVTIPTLNSNEWYWLRFRVNGTDLKAKIWAGEHLNEPAAWTIERTDANIAGPGWMGVGNAAATGTSRDYDDIAVGTSGDTAAFPVSEEVRVTQAPLLVLTEADSDVRITQSAVLALAFMPDSAEEIRVTQAVALALSEFSAGLRITQAAVLVLADQVPCVSHWSQCWTITRRDGQVFAFTSHDRPVQWRGVTHIPCDSLAATATEMSASTGAVGNMELRGLVSDDSITEQDMLNGLFDRAYVEVWIVPWSQEQGETPIRLLAGTTGELSHNVNEFNYEVLTPGAQLQQKNVIETYTPGCRYDFGDSRCTVDTVALSVAGSVTATVARNGSTYATRRAFIDSTRVEADGYFAMGTVTWTSGPNNGVSREVKDFIGGQFILWEPLLHEIGLGDTYIAKPGCAKNPDACKGYSNYINYGGYPDVPGQDAIAETPDAKG